MARQSARILGIAVLAMGSALADSLVLTDPGYGGGGSVMGGVYVSPYSARYTNSLGQSSAVQVICDDFAAVTYLNQPFQVNAISFADLPGQLQNTRWGNTSLPGNQGAQALTTYYEAAWLALQMFGTTNTTVRGQISFAIWGLFTPSALSNLSGANLTAAQGYIAAAQNASSSFTAGQFSNFVLYVPNPLRVPGSPQEFIAIRTPEPGVVAIWLLTLFTVAGIGAFLKSRIGFASQS